MSVHKKWMTISQRDGFTILDLGIMEIWDGADMALMRDVLNELITRKKCRAIAINMQYVKYIPSGFFGMLYDLNEQGVSIRLEDPQPNVRNMLWFRKFFQWEEGEIFNLSHPINDEELLPESEDWEQAEPVSDPELDVESCTSNRHSQKSSS